MERAGQTPSDLQRPPGNDLVSNYQKHDVGEAWFKGVAEMRGFAVEDYGIDMRHDDGDDGVIYDDRMDFVVRHDGEMVGYVDIKTKSNPKYLGRFNRRHYDHYREHAAEVDVPCYVVLAMVDSTAEAVVDAYAARIVEDGGGFVASTEEDAVPHFPDGNRAVYVYQENRTSIWTAFERMKELGHHD